MSDYDRIAAAIDFIATHAHHQPSLADVAAQVHLSPYHFQRLFSRWAGITPKRFLQVLTLEHAKQALRESKTLYEAVDVTGLSGGSRLYDHFVQLDAVTPGEYRSGGEGLTVEYGVHPTPFGDAFVAMTPRGICRLAFVGEEGTAPHLEELSGQWSRARLQENTVATAPIVDALTAAKPRRAPLSLYVCGTNFQINVWRALLDIPPGMVTSYSQVATALGRPRAARSVATAIGANPVALLIPCHRVIRESGHLTGYRWGSTRKRAILAWEAARCAPGNGNT